MNTWRRGKPLYGWTPTVTVCSSPNKALPIDSSPLGCNTFSHCLFQHFSFSVGKFFRASQNFFLLPQKIPSNYSENSFKLFRKSLFYLEHTLLLSKRTHPESLPNQSVGFTNYLVFGYRNDYFLLLGWYVRVTKHSFHINIPRTCTNQIQQPSGIGPETRDTGDTSRRTTSDLTASCGIILIFFNLVIILFIFILLNCFKSNTNLRFTVQNIDVAYHSFLY